MKRLILSTGFAWAAFAAMCQQKTEIKDSFYSLSPVEVRAIRASENAPVTKTNFSKKEIEKANLGQDLPFLLNQTPSVVINSDAGNGVGYTGIRIRGTDATRINITLNGIPYNDAESQGSFFVDLPDFASSVNSIQIQRGIGSSSNGAGAFGATINFSTNDLNKTAYAEINNSYGSFNTWKHTVKIGSGLVANHFSIDARASQISSDGFIDRAFSKLQSFYISPAYTGKKDELRLNIFKGYEKTYQAWYGISESDLKAGKRTTNYAGMEKPGEPYDDETDNYWQDHYQLFYTHRFHSLLDFNTAFFYTPGKGYYQQYKADEPYAKYGLPALVTGSDTIYNSDFIRRLWLDNDFFGNIFSLQYRHRKTEITIGGAITKYLGNHFGELKWASNGLTSLKDWYDLDAKKTDWNVYTKLLYKFTGNLDGYADVQTRNVRYNINGFRDNPELIVHNQYHFFNPKFGFSFHKNDWRYYTSYSIAHKEPNRDDFEAGLHQQPKPEELHDWEFGVEEKKKNYSWGTTLYYMNYRNQLVLTGKINDVGAYTRTNIPESYRAGIEIWGGITPVNWLNVSGNIALSRNKIRNFTEYIDDYDNGNQKENFYSLTDISYSPSIVAAGTVNFYPVKNFEISLPAKYVGKQYLDNTSNESRKLDAFYVQDARLSYSFNYKWMKNILLIAQVNNVLNEQYEPNGYTFSYVYVGQLTTENYYFPMAGRNFMVSVNLRF